MHSARRKTIMSFNPVANINIEIRAGTSIKQACAAALAIASKLEYIVSFVFNEQEIVVRPYQTLSQILISAYRQLGLEQSLRPLRLCGERNC